MWEFIRNGKTKEMKRNIIKTTLGWCRFFLYLHGFMHQEFVYGAIIGDL
jgi:hypothetical protein